MRRIVVGVIALAAIVITGLIAWNFAGIGRRAPQIARTDVNATSILVEKGPRRLTLFHGNEPIRTYEVSIGRNPVGHKQREGDSRTPEGKYVIDGKKRSSRFHWALHISYPNAQDKAAGARNGVRQLGGDIEVHGLPDALAWIGPLHRLINWTDGCVAVTNAEIEEIYPLVDTGTPIEIRP